MSGLGIIGGRYIIEDLIGQGAMGAVYRGLDTHTDQTVAIKYLKPEIVREDPDFVERFIREGEALRKLNHPNIVKMLDAIEEHGSHYIVLEFVSSTLSETLREHGRLPVKQVLDIGLDLADALTRAHRLNIIHRDLKPANVLMADDNTPRLTDFGHARIGDQSRLTRSGYLVGTYAYLSPEMVNGEEIDERADIWALGVMLYEMLAGQRPFTEVNPAALLKGILVSTPPDLRGIRPDAPEELVRLIEWMLEKTPAARIPSVRQVGAILEALLNEGDAAALFDAPHRTPAAISAAPPVSITTANPAELATDLDPQEHPAQVASGTAASPTPSAPPLGVPSLYKLRDDTPTQPSVMGKAPKSHHWSARLPRVLVVVLGVIVVLLAGILLLRPTYPAQNLAASDDAPALSVPPVAAGEVMVLVADFEALEGASSANPARFIYDDLVAHIENNPFSNIRIRRYERVISSDAQAESIAQDAGAAVIVWGRYFSATDIEAEVRIGDLTVFADNIFPRASIAAIVNVRLSLTDPRRESLAIAVLALVVTLQSADDNGFEVNRLLVMLDQASADTTPPVLSPNSLAEYVHLTFQRYSADPSAALTALDAARERDRSSNALLSQMNALLNYRVGNITAARTSLASARATAPTYMLPNFLEGIFVMNDGRYDEAVSLISLMVDARPDDWYPLNFRAAAYYLDGQYDLAWADYERALALEPQANFPYIPAAFILLRQGRVLESAQLIDTVIVRFPDTTFSMRMLASTFGSTSGEVAVFGPAFSAFTNLILRRYDLAIADVDAALLINPNLADLHLARGYAYCNLAYLERERGETEAAAANFQQSIDGYSAGITLEPDYAVLHLLRAEVYRASGQVLPGVQDMATVSQLNVSAELATLAGFGVREEIGCRNFYDDAARLLTLDATPEG